ncbi:MAG: helix-turn-helix transcriptional regulator [Candidatus Limiplasma sp.]|nr:helix-turn-helix transcriptional regulator [Candidatus Limiplasma sp.]
MLKDNLRKARENANMTKAELARNLGIPYSTYDSYETGHRTPKPDQLPVIAKALEVDVQFLLIGKQFSIPRSENHEDDLQEDAKIFSATWALYRAYGFTYRHEGDLWVITDRDGHETSFNRHNHQAYATAVTSELEKYALYLHYNEVQKMLAAQEEREE